MKNAIFIKDLCTTQCSMDQVIQELKKEHNVDELCRSNSFNPSLLHPLLRLLLRGYNNSDIARKLGIHRITVQRYIATLKKLKESEFQLLCEFLLRDETEVKNENANNYKHRQDY